MKIMEWIVFAVYLATMALALRFVLDTLVNAFKKNLEINDREL